MSDKPCKNCEACACCEPCGHCGNCRNCGKPIYTAPYFYPITPPYRYTWPITWGPPAIGNDITTGSIGNDINAGTTYS